jgi:hypothetical protein
MWVWVSGWLVVFGSLFVMRKGMMVLLVCECALGVVHVGQ